MMEMLIVGGVVVAVIVGLVKNVFGFVIDKLTPLAILGAVFLIFGFLYGGADMIFNPTESEWTSLIDILLGDGSGERVVDGFLQIVRGSYEIIVRD